MNKLAMALLLSLFTIKMEGKKLLSYNLVDGLPSIYITPRSEKIGHTWSGGYVYEKPLIEQFYRLLAQQTKPFVVLDLGAQTGCFSLLAKFFPHSRWYAFEPLKEAAHALQANLACNHIHNVSVHQVAVSNYCGRAILKMPARKAWGLATIGANPLRFDPVIERRVRCINLDTFVEQQAISHVDFMKLDTEGSELYILRGAEKMINRDRPIILMEYNETNMRQCGIAKNDVDDFLKGGSLHLDSN